MPKKMKENKKAEVHKDLTGFDINIDTFGQLKSSLDIDKLNTFLNETGRQPKKEDPTEDSFDDR